MRCPECRATNPDTAAFCSLCHARFGTREGTAEDQDPVAATNAVTNAVAPLGQSATETDALGSGGSPQQSATAGRFHAADGALGWSCALCGEANDLAVFTCTVCGARMDAEAADPDAVIDWAGARRTELLAPGIGHIQVGAAGMGYARVATVVLWLLGTLALASGGTAGLVTAVPLVIGVLVIWATGPGDLAAIRRNQPPRLDPRRLMFLVIGVIVGVVVLGGFIVAL